MFIRGFMVISPIILVIIFFSLVLKKRHRVLVVLLVLCMLFSVFVPVRMFLFNQKQVPNIDKKDLNFFYEEFKNKLNSGQENVNDINIVNSNEYRSVYKNVDESTISIFVYDSSLNDEINNLKDTAVVYYTNGDVSIWASEMEPTSADWFMPIIGISGEFVMKSKHNNETILVHYCIKGFDGFSAVFPKYPEFDILNYLSSCNVLV